MNFSSKIGDSTNVLSLSCLARPFFECFNQPKTSQLFVKHFSFTLYHDTTCSFLSSNLVTSHLSHSWYGRLYINN